MPEKIKKTITEINAEVDIIAVKEEQWGAEVIARVVDTGTIGDFEPMVPEAVGMAYRTKYNMPDEEYNGIKGECVISDQAQPNAWYTHVKVFRKKRK
jgi:hypothetical protein